jgi:hypothetical protein
MLLDKFSRVIGETTPNRFGAEAGETASTMGPAATTTWQNAVAGVLLRNVGNPLDAESLAAPWQDAPETPGRFETVYRRPRNLDHEFSGGQTRRPTPSTQRTGTAEGE